MKDLKQLIPFGIVLLIGFYILPLFAKDTGRAIIILLVAIPLLCLVCSFIYGKLYGFQILYIIIVVLLFIPSIFIFYNESALVYVFVYGIVGLVGNLTGSLMKKSS